MPVLLIVEDEEVLARNLGKALARKGFDVQSAASLAAAQASVASTPPDVVLLDLRLPDGSGLDLLDALLARDPELPVIMMTAYGSVADAVQAMQRGARDYVQKPFELDEIYLKVEHARRAARERREISYYRERSAATGGILGESPAAEHLRTLVARIARMTTGPGAPAPTVLLLVKPAAARVMSRTRCTPRAADAADRSSR